MLINAYNDSFLSRHVTDEKENAAYDYVDLMADFTPDWRDRLAVLRVYISICLDAQKGGQDDVYATKLASYRKEFDAVVALAKAAKKNGVTVSPAFSDLSVNAGRY